MTITVGYVCSGYGGAELAFRRVAEPVFMSEIEPFPRAILSHWFPDVPLHGDFTLLIEDPPICDILAGGTPCFPAGTTVTLRRGIVPIEDVRVGDDALTHTGIWKPVLRVGSKIADTVILKGQGHEGLETTSEHPFLSRKRMGRSTRVNGKSVRLTWWSEVEWEEARDMPGRHWALPTSYPVLPIPAPMCVGNESVRAEISEELLELAGAYVGDGWVRMDERRGYTVFGLNAAKLGRIKPILERMGVNLTVSEERTAFRTPFKTLVL